MDVVLVIVAAALVVGAATAVAVAARDHVALLVRLRRWPDANDVAGRRYVRQAHRKARRASAARAPATATAGPPVARSSTAEGHPVAPSVPRTGAGQVLVPDVMARPDRSAALVPTRPVTTIVVRRSTVVVGLGLLGLAAAVRIARSRR